MIDRTDVKMEIKVMAVSLGKLNHKKGRNIF